MADSVGIRLPTIGVILTRRSFQSFALRWYPPEGQTLDMSNTVVTLEIDDTRISTLTYEAETTPDPDVAGAWLTKWEIDEEDSHWTFRRARGRIRSKIGTADPVVLMSATVEVQD